jgi:hypothetical protein
MRTPPTGDGKEQMLSGNIDYGGATDYVTEADYDSFPDLQYMYVLDTWSAQ